MKTASVSIDIYNKRRRHERLMHWLQLASAVVLGLAAAWVASNAHADEPSPVAIARANNAGHYAIASHAAVVERITSKHDDWTEALRTTLAYTRALSQTAMRPHQERR